MSDKKVWLVEQNTQDSYGDGYNDTYITISTHASEAGAEAAAEKLRKNLYVYNVTSGRMDTADASPDEIVGVIDDPDVANEVRAEAAKPGAVFIEAVEVVAMRRQNNGTWSMPNVTVKAEQLLD